MIFHIQNNKAASEPLNLIQVTDSHLLKNPEHKFAGISPIASLRAILDCIQTHHDLNIYDAIITTGDIAQEPAHETYQQYHDEIARLQRPHFLVPGNHDEIPTESLQSHKIEEPTVILGHNWCLILLNSQCHEQIHGEFSADYLSNLSDLLTQYNDYHVLLAFHHHSIPVGSAWLDQHRLQNAEAFLACIHQHQNVKVILSGHVHQEFDHFENGVRFLAAPATSIQFKPKSENFSLDDQPPGYRVLSLHANGEIDTQVYRLNECVGSIDLDLREY